MAHDDLDDYCDFVREETDLRLGIEADFVPGREDRMPTCSTARDWDYVVGSVHFLRDDAVDPRRLDVWDIARRSPTRSGARYFETLGEAARSGLFDIIAHPDLVKVWGGQARPDGDLRRFYEPAMEGFAESGVAVEVSTAGLRKPVGELYPAAPFLEMCWTPAPDRAVQDAHCPTTSAPTTSRRWSCSTRLGVERARRVRAARAADGAARMSGASGIGSTPTASPRAGGWFSAAWRSPTTRGPRGPLRRRRARPRGHRRPARRGRARRHRPALPRRRRALARRRLDRPAARGRRGLLDAAAAVDHVDATVLCEAPEAAPTATRCARALAEALGLEDGAVNVKATTGEGMGFVGREEGIAALAVATLA